MFAAISIVASIVSAQLNSQACTDARAVAESQYNSACPGGCSATCEAELKKQSNLQNARQFYQICQPSEFETNFFLSSSKKKIDDYNKVCGTNIGFDLTYESISSTPTIPPLKGTTTTTTTTTTRNSNSSPTDTQGPILYTGAGSFYSFGVENVVLLISALLF
jgi:hypothetical protein